MEKGICGLVILYHPEKEVVENVLSYLPYVEKLWIIDNSEQQLTDLQAWFSGHGNIEIWQDRENKGIGSRINFAAQKAIAAGFSWLLTMDQDSRFTPDNIRAYITKIAKIGKAGDIAVVGVEHDLAEKPHGPVTEENVMTVITSGSCLNLRLIAAIGFMNEEFFIDEVDTEYCYRSLVKRYRVVICKGIYLVHQLGERVWARSVITGKKTNRSLHSPIRLYYITRNFHSVKKQYKSSFPEHFKKRTQELYHIYKNNLLYNPYRGKILRMIYKGYKDFKKNKSGRLEQ